MSGLVTKKLDKYLNNECNLNIFKKTNDLYDNQINCALSVLTRFDSGMPRTNHVIVKGLTQSGKTGVFISIVNIIIKEQLANTLNINKIIYLTGDNSKSLIKQTDERINKQIFNNEYIEIIKLKQSDCSKTNIELKNSLIFLDESHYGTSKFDNKVIQLLSKNGLDLRSSKNLELNDTYIISNSATPYGELVSDIDGIKTTVLLSPGDGYIGIIDFKDNIVGIEKQVYKNENDLKDWLIETHGYIKSTNKNLCALVRIENNSFKKYQKLIEEYYEIFEVNSKSGNVDYNSMVDKITLKCQYNHNLTPNKFLMIIVNGGLRMGISIPDEIKSFIGVIYDYSVSGISTTEQGLLGRMTGYRKDDSYKLTKFYLNKGHIDSLIDMYENVRNDSSGILDCIPVTWKKVKSKKFYNNLNEIPSGCEIKFGAKQDYVYVYDNTEFNEEFKSVLKEILKTENKGKHYAQNVRKFLQSTSEWYNSIDDVCHTDSRNHYSNDSFTKNFTTNELFSAGAKGSERYEFFHSNKYIGKRVYKTLIDDRDKYNIKLVVVSGIIKPYTEIENKIQKENKIIETFNTKI